MTELPHDFERYLASKRTVDDRALNAAVWRALRQQLDSVERAPLMVLELGAGTGTMVERILAWDLFGERAVHYTAIDKEPDNIRSLRSGLERVGAQLELHAETADLNRIVDRTDRWHCYDLLIAHAFLDLIDLPSMLPSIAQLLRPGGLFYATINFDGVSAFEPTIDPVFDDLVERLYHETMDTRTIGGKPSGDSRTGRHMFGHLRANGFEILEAGSSDWVVFARENGDYRDDEAFFLRYILGFIQEALRDHPALERTAFARWMQTRYDQLAHGDLVYVAHQLDFLARRRP